MAHEAKNNYSLDLYIKCLLTAGLATGLSVDLRIKSVRVKILSLLFTFEHEHFTLCPMSTKS